MRFPTAVAGVMLAATTRLASGWALPNPFSGFGKNTETNALDMFPEKSGRIAPKVMIISMFDPEAEIWYQNLPLTEYGPLTTHAIPTPGLSILFPYIHCTTHHTICQITVGEAEINAAASISALTLSPHFDLRQTYFLVAGIAGINPKIGTQGSVAFSKYAIQVALQYEFDAREMPENFSTGYFSYGSGGPDEYPTILYGTEVFELSEVLRDACVGFAEKAELADTEGHREYGKRYLALDDEVYAPAARAPSVVRADSATSDVYYSGKFLSETFENITRTWTNSSGVYGVTAQEENATLEVLLRAAVEGTVDFGRVVVMRTGSNFDRPPPGVSVYEHLVIRDQDGLGIATENIFRAGIEVVRGIVGGWDCKFGKGVRAGNYIGDVFGSLGGFPDFGLGSLTEGRGVRGLALEERQEVVRKRAEIRKGSKMGGLPK